MEQPHAELMKRGFTMEDVMEEKKPLIGNERTEEKETPEKLQAMIAAYVRQKGFAESDKSRFSDLLQRKSAQKWDPTKKAKMVRRYMRADQLINECVDTLEKLKDRLSTVTKAKDPNYNVAPFVPPPATSLEG